MNKQPYLYNYRKALDEVLALGRVPRRLYSIFYPIWCVRVKGRQRVAVDFDEIEWFIMRGLYEAELHSVEQLANFLGLKQRFVRQLVEFLKSIGQIEEHDQWLHLTMLGEKSVQERICYQDLSMEAMLYFDGLRSRPLSIEHAAVPVYTPRSQPQESSFTDFSNFDRPWDENAINGIMTSPERTRYGIMDEVTTIEPLGKEQACLPVYIVECRADEQKKELPFLVFSRIRGRRDQDIEKAVNADSDMLNTLVGSGQGELEEVVAKLLGERGLDEKQWDLNPQGPYGPQVVVHGEVFTQSVAGTATEIAFDVKEIGRYLLKNRWCLWVTCDDATIRQKAAIEQLLEWIQGVVITPKIGEFEKELALMQERLEVDPVGIETLRTAARQRGWEQALERLDAFMPEK